ncbi:hypothetical protein EVAR_24233_1 [Eumeta japonica]|uniref:Uncharacterized protein n=1 Tax=Eumeta variegata TaxID=151549 RepID=A0A4C1W683_EUMVA|nr:hypothetical protein EVAR_24233_1 [Eumeta japonica]
MILLVTATVWGERNSQSADETLDPSGNRGVRRAAAAAAAGINRDPDDVYPHSRPDVAPCASAGVHGAAVGGVARGRPVGGPFSFFVILLILASGVEIVPKLDTPAGYSARAPVRSEQSPPASAFILEGVDALLCLIIVHRPSTDAGRRTRGRAGRVTSGPLVYLDTAARASSPGSGRRVSRNAHRRRRSCRSIITDFRSLMSVEQSLFSLTWRWLLLDFMWQYICYCITIPQVNLTSKVCSPV